MSKIINMLLGIGLILFGISSAINFYIFHIDWLVYCAIFSPIIGILELIISYISWEKLHSTDTKPHSEE
jgi:hypothetical protein